MLYSCSSHSLATLSRSFPSRRFQSLRSEQIAQLAGCTNQQSQYHYGGLLDYLPGVLESAFSGAALGVRPLFLFFRFLLSSYFSRVETATREGCDATHGRVCCFGASEFCGKKISANGSLEFDYGIALMQTKTSNLTCLGPERLVFFCAVPDMASRR